MLEVSVKDKKTNEDLCAFEVEKLVIMGDDGDKSYSFVRGTSLPGLMNMMADALAQAILHTAKSTVGEKGTQVDVVKCGGEILSNVNNAKDKFFEGIKQSLIDFTMQELGDDESMKTVIKALGDELGIIDVDSMIDIVEKIKTMNERGKA